MSDLIDRHMAITHVYAVLFPNVSAAKKAEKAIREMPTIDAVPVVRCKDCMFFEIMKNEHIGDCNYWQDQGRAVSTFPDDFCSYGERRNDETD